MFVSRSAIDSHDGRHGQSVLIEIEEGCSVDKGVVPSVIEFVLGDVISRAVSRKGDNGNVALVCIDRSSRDYRGLIRRCAIPVENVVDGFSEWYAPEENPGADSVKRDTNARLVHIANIRPCSEMRGSVAKEVFEVWNSSATDNARRRIVVIDSLSSFFRFYPGVDSFLDFRDNLYSFGRKNGAVSVVLIGVIRQTTKNASVVASLRRTFDTFAVISQKATLDDQTKRRPTAWNENRDLVALKICKRKLSGRVQLEEVTTRIQPNTGILEQVEVKNVDFTDVSVLNNEEEQRRQEKALGELGLTFRVSLSTKEREVRAAAGLPYLHQDEKLADSALELHPESLQIGEKGSPAADSPDSEESDTDSDEELFSEDV